MSDVDILRNGGYLTYNKGRRRQWTVTDSPRSYYRHGGAIEDTVFFKVEPSSSGLMLTEVTPSRFMEIATSET